VSLSLYIPCSVDSVPHSYLQIEATPDEHKEKAIEKHENSTKNNEVDLVQEWAKVGGRAMMKFKELDADGDGELDVNEMEGLVDWILKIFRPGGSAMSKELHATEAEKLVSKLDAVP